MWSGGMCWLVTESTHIPTRLKGAKSLVGRQRSFRQAPAVSVANVAVLVSYEPQEVEAESQQGGAQ